MWEGIKVWTARSNDDESNILYFYHIGRNGVLEFYDDGEVILLLSNRQDKTVPTTAEDVTHTPIKEVFDRIIKFMNSNNEQQRETD